MIELQLIDYVCYHGLRLRESVVALPISTDEHFSHSRYFLINIQINQLIKLSRFISTYNNVKFLSKLQIYNE